MSVNRGNSPAHSFKPIPEDKVCGQVIPRRHSSSSCNSHHDTTTDPDPPAVPVESTSPAQQNGDSTPEAQIQELRKLLTDWQDEGKGGRGGGGYVSGGGGSRPPSRSSLRSSSSRQGSRIGSRRGSWVASEDEDEVTGSQKAHLLVASQQRLVYTLQGLRHELASLDEEVNRIRNDVLNSRRYHNALRGVHEQPTWGSGHRRTATAAAAAAAAAYHMGSSSSSPSIYSLDNSYSDEADSLARSESCSSFASWRSEAELFNVFREAEEVAGLDKNSSRHSIPANGRSDTSNSNDNGCNSSGGSTGSYNSSSVVPKDSGNGSSNSQNSGSPVIRGRYRQLGTSHGTPRR